MALAWNQFPVVETLTTAWQCIFVNPDSTQTFKGTVQDILDLTSGSGEISTETQSTIWASDYVNTVNNGVRFDDETAQPWNFITGKSSANSVINDRYDYNFKLALGNYTLEIVYQTTNFLGVGSFYIDNVKQGDVDFYSSALTSKLISTIPVVVSTSGSHVLSLRIESKNASSTAYGSRCTRFRIY